MWKPEFLMRCGGLLGLMALGSCAHAAGGRTAGRLSLYWVDVEGGAATLLVTPAGESLLVDTGMDGERDPGRIARLAREVAGIQQIDHLVVTHFDVDHHGGAAAVSKRIPIRAVYDPGDEGARPQAGHDKYVAFRKSVSYSVLKPGDAIPLRQAPGARSDAAGAAKLSITCLAAARRRIAAGPQHKPNPIPPSEAPEYPADPSDNARSVVLLVRLGAFEFLDAADLTGRLELGLVCPVNLVGEVDVYQVTHHGLDLSNNPVLVRSIQPTVTVMNNGDRKGCGPKTRAALKAVASIQANYQLHKSLAPGADNTPEELIANLEPAAACKAHHVELHVAPDGSSYTVRIPATAHERSFRAK